MQDVPAETIIKHYVNKHAAEPFDPARAFPELAVKADGQVKQGVDGWVKVGGQLKQITGIWVKVGGQIKQA